MQMVNLPPLSFEEFNMLGAGLGHLLLDTDQSRAREALTEKIAQFVQPQLSGDNNGQIPATKENSSSETRTACS